MDAWIIGAAILIGTGFIVDAIRDAGKRIADRLWDIKSGLPQDPR